jgi:hypothetical protein
MSIDGAGGRGTSRAARKDTVGPKSRQRLDVAAIAMDETGQRPGSRRRRDRGDRIPADALVRAARLKGEGIVAQAALVAGPARTSHARRRPTWAASAAQCCLERGASFGYRAERFTTEYRT